MGVYSIAKPKSIVESFVEQCERMDNIAENVLSYNEASIPVFANNNKYYVESDMLIKLMDTKNYSLVEAVDALCFENNIDKDDMTVVINTENAVDEDSIEEMYEFMQEAWKNNVSVAAKDSKGKKIELTINGQKSVIKVKNIDKQIYKAQKQLDKFKETKAWWDGLTEEERKKKSNMRKIVSIALLAVQGALVFFSYTTANPIAIITSSIISIGIGGANIAQMNTGKGTAGMLNPDLILDQNGNKIYKNTSDYLKRMVDMYEKIIKALEDYKRKNG